MKKPLAPEHQEFQFRSGAERWCGDLQPPSGREVLSVEKEQATENQTGDLVTLVLEPAPERPAAILDFRSRPASEEDL